MIWQSRGRSWSNSAVAGSKNLAGDEASLYFSIDGRSPEGKRINRFKITREPSDTYKLEGFYCHVSRIDIAPVVAAEDIYCDMLEEVFTRLTGLYTSLARKWR